MVFAPDSHRIRTVFAPDSHRIRTGFAQDSREIRIYSQYSRSIRHIRSIRSIRIYSHNVHRIRTEFAVSAQYSQRFARDSHGIRTGFAKIRMGFARFASRSEMDSQTFAQVRTRSHRVTSGHTCECARKPLLDSAARATARTEWSDASSSFVRAQSIRPGVLWRLVSMHIRHLSASPRGTDASRSPRGAPSEAVPTGAIRVSLGVAMVITSFVCLCSS